MKKYEFTDDKIEFDGQVLTRIRALVDIPRFNVKAGDLGGYIEKERNLSHIGDCWVGGNARVFEQARVFGNARVYGNALVFGNACVPGNAKIESNDDFIVLGPAKSSGRYTTAYKTQDSKIRVLCGCFVGTPDEFFEAINVTHANSEEFRNQYLDFHKQIVEKFKNL